VGVVRHGGSGWSADHDPESADRERERRQGCRGLWLASTLDDLVAVDGLLEPEAGQTVMAALEPLARPADAGDSRHGGQRTADAGDNLGRLPPDPAATTAPGT